MIDRLVESTRLSLRMCHLWWYWQFHRFRTVRISEPPLQRMHFGGGRGEGGGGGGHGYPDDNQQINHEYMNFFDKNDSFSKTSTALISWRI